MEFYKNRPRRLLEQEWIIEKIFELGGPEIYWEPLRESLITVGTDCVPDLDRMKTTIKRRNHIYKEFSRFAAKREAMAKKAEKEGHVITARDNYFSAAIFYHQARLPFEDDNVPESISCNKKMLECYDKFIKYAPRPIEKVEIPFEGQSLPCYFHLPPNRTKKVPCILDIGGTHLWKETLNQVYGDKTIERGMAVFSIDLPGQGEALMRGMRLSKDNCIKGAKAAIDYLVKRPEIDAAKIGIRGTSLGCNIVPWIVAHERRIKSAACVLFSYACPDEPWRTIPGPPSLAQNHMAGITNEEESQKVRKTWTLEPEKIKCPIILLGGEDQESNPIECAIGFYKKIAGPKKIVIYEGQPHGVEHAMDLRTLAADWLRDGVDGKITKHEEILYVDREGFEKR